MAQTVEVVLQPDGSYTLELVEEPVDLKVEPVGVGIKELIEGYVPPWAKEEDRDIAEVQAIFAPFDPAKHVELDPPTGNFLWTLLTDWMQRYNFAAANVFRGQLEEAEPKIKERQALVQQQYPKMSPEVAKMWAGIQLEAAREISTIFPATAAALLDLILNKDSEGAANFWAGMTAVDMSTFMDLAYEREVWELFGLTEERLDEVVPGTMGLVTLHIIPMAIGLGLDMGADIFTWLPYAATVKLIGKGGKALSKTQIAVRLKKMLLDTSVGKVLEKAVGTVGEAFIPGYKIPQEFHDKIKWAVRNERFEEAEIMKKARNFYIRIREKNDGAIAKLMTYVRQHPDELNKLSASNQKLLKEIGDEFMSLGQEAVDAGLITQKAFNKNKLTYVWGYYPEYTRIIGKRLPPSKFQRMSTPSFAQPRHFKTIEDAKDFAKSLSVFDDVDNMREMNRIAKSFRREKAVPLTRKEFAAEFKRVGKRVDLAEKSTPLPKGLDPKGWMDDWKKWSKARGYSEAEIKDFERWIELAGKGGVTGVTDVSPGGTYARHLKAGTVPTKTEIGPSFLERAFQYLDNVDEAKSYVKALQASHTVEEDLIKIYAGYAIQVRRAIAGDEFINSTLVEFGRKVSARYFQGVVPKGKALFLPTGQLRYYPGGKKAQAIVDQIVKLSGGEGRLVVMDDEVAKLVGQLEDISLKHVGVTKRVNAYLIDENIAYQLNRTGSLMFDDNVANQFLRVTDKLFGWWKMMATSARLPFHSRNAYSSAMMNYFDGMEVHEIVQYYTRATKMLMGKGGSATVRGTGVVYSADELLEAAGRLGAMDAGWIGHARKPIWQQLDQLQRTGRIKAALNPLEAGRKLGTAVENQARFAKFIERVEKGDDFKAAAERVFATHYDYSSLGLTEFEVKYMKRMIPFYTWTRKNTPRMGYILMTQPQRVSMLGKMQRALYNMNPETTDERVYKPEYMDEQMWFKAPEAVSRMFGGDETIYIRFDTPLNELVGIGEAVLFDNLKPIRQQVLSMINPWGMKGFAEGLSVFLTEKGTGIETFPRIGPVQTFPGKKVPAPWFMLFFPEWLQERAGIGMYTDMRTGKRIVGMPAWAKHLLYGTIPLAREIDRLHPDPVDVEIGFSPWRKLTFFTGIGFAPVNVAEQKFWKEREARNELQMWKRPFFQDGVPPTREDKERMLRELGYSEAEIKKALRGVK